MAGFGKKIVFSAKNYVLASWLLVRIVNQQDFHDAFLANPKASGGSSSGVATTSGFSSGSERRVTPTITPRGPITKMYEAVLSVSMLNRAATSARNVAK